MTPLPFVWPHALLFWSVEIWAFVPEYQIIRRAGKTSDQQDAKSKQVIMIGSGLTFPAAVAFGFFGPLRIVSHRLAWFYAGIAILVLGSLLRRHCWRMLGSSFTGNVEARAGQEVVTRGAYSILRHPSYTAALLVNVGVGIAFGSWAAAILAAVVSLVVYSYRMQVEERALVGAIGAPYEEFMRTRKRIIPFIY
jgi:protein-S-isoprenylcysteine O-methyltransferase Ste14